MELQGTQNNVVAKTILKKNKVVGLILPSFQTSCEAVVCYRRKDGYIDQWNRVENPEIQPYVCHLIFGKGARTVHWGTETVFSTSGAGRTG